MIGRKPKSPLTNHFGENFGGGKPKRKRVFIGAALLLVVPYIGSTLAASVTITGRGGSTAIEFGQGNQVAITCDTSITSQLDESWYATNTLFRVDTILLSGINVSTATTATTNDQGCGGKNLTLKLFTGTGGSSAAAIIGSIGSATSVTFVVPTSTTNTLTFSANTGITGAATIESSVGSITLTIPTAVNLDASSITRVSIETD
jgi:hypothetical protein